MSFQEGALALPFTRKAVVRAYVVNTFTYEDALVARDS